MNFIPCLIKVKCARVKSRAQNSLHLKKSLQGRILWNKVIFPFAADLDFFRLLFFTNSTILFKKILILFMIFPKIFVLVLFLRFIILNVQLMKIFYVTE